MCAFSHLLRHTLLFALAFPAVGAAEPRIGVSALAELSLGVPSRAGVTGLGVNSFWMDELERRVFSLAVPVLESPLDRFAAQTSPRYAAHELPDVTAPMLVWAWALPAPSVDDREALEAAGDALTGAGSVLARSLVERELASEVRARLFEREGHTLFALFVFGTTRGKDTNLNDVVERALGEFSLTGPIPHLGQAGVRSEAVRLAVNRHLLPTRRVVVELLPRNTPDPALTLRSGSERTNAPGVRPLVGRKPARLHPVKRGDTLLGIARRYDVSVRELVAENRIDPERPIRLGQKLVVPHRKVPSRQAGSARASLRKRTKNRS